MRILLQAFDHGEDLEELNVHCDRRSASEYTTHVPLIIHWSGITDQPGISRCDSRLYYHIDFGATLLEFADVSVSDNWLWGHFVASFVQIGTLCTKTLLFSTTDNEYDNE